MKNKPPSFFQLIRAPFLFAITSPLLFGTFLLAGFYGSFDLYGFLLALGIGLSLHVSTNVYNDIYDTMQGVDNKVSQKSRYSGGSGVLIDYPALTAKMFNIARAGLVAGFMFSLLLFVHVDVDLKPYVVFLYLVSAFLSKYYTAPPIKFAYRGLGEFVVWFGFGPLAMLLAALGQNTLIPPQLWITLPLTGITTLFIVWMGQLMDYGTDGESGKLGWAIRLGPENAIYAFFGLHILALLNVVLLVVVLRPGHPFLISLLPPSLFLPDMWACRRSVFDKQKKHRFAQENFSLYLWFSAAVILASFLYAFF